MYKINIIQYNAAVLYLEKNKFRVKQQNSYVLIWTIGLSFLLLFLYFLKFLVALP
jgi:hypothetical protein